MLHILAGSDEGKHALSKITASVAVAKVAFGPTDGKYYHDLIGLH